MRTRRNQDVGDNIAPRANADVSDADAVPAAYGLEDFLLIIAVDALTMPGKHAR
jgi:hypothetical protein